MRAPARVALCEVVPDASAGKRVERMNQMRKISAAHHFQKQNESREPRQRGGYSSELRDEVKDDERIQDREEMTIDQPPENDHDRRQSERCEHGPKEPRRFVEKRPGSEKRQDRRGRDRQLQDAVRSFQERIFIRPFRGPALDPKKGRQPVRRK